MATLLVYSKSRPPTQLNMISTLALSKSFIVANHIRWIILSSTKVILVSTERGELFAYDIFDRTLRLVVNKRFVRYSINTYPNTYRVYGYQRDGTVYDLLEAYFLFFSHQYLNTNISSDPTIIKDVTKVSQLKRDRTIAYHNDASPDIASIANDEYAGQIQDIAMTADSNMAVVTIDSLT